MGRRFDWERFLRQQRIDYIQADRGNLGVRCPFCGPSDHHQNMRISTEGRGWKCWRDPLRHSGRSPVRLIAALAGCSEAEARQIAGVEDQSVVAPTTSDLEATLARLGAERSAEVDEVVDNKVPLELPASFHRLTNDWWAAERFWDYLRGRGYRDREIRWLVDAYDLRGATVGDFAWRLVFPVRDPSGRLQTWTGRALGDKKQPRYRTLSVARGPAHVATPQTLLGLDQLWKADDPRVLVLTEGPLDATRISVSGAPLGVWGTCLFGLNLSAAQSELIHALAGRFARVAVLLDDSAQLLRLRIARTLSPLEVMQPRLPEGVGDPGALTAAEATRLCIELSAL